MCSTARGRELLARSTPPSSFSGRSGKDSGWVARLLSWAQRPKLKKGIAGLRLTDQSSNRLKIEPGDQLSDLKLRPCSTEYNRWLDSSTKTFAFGRARSPISPVGSTFKSSALKDGQASVVSA